jgi:hypothetical protein
MCKKAIATVGLFALANLVHAQAPERPKLVCRTSSTTPDILIPPHEYMKKGMCARLSEIPAIGTESK